MVRLTRGRFDALADRHHFIIVYPNGVDRSWNDGRTVPISTAHREKIDDVGFIRALVTSLAVSYPIDLHRVFVTGISNGGMMSLRLGCDLPDLIRGIAPVAASLPADIESSCTRAAGVSLAMISGTEDPLVPYGGGEVRAFGRDRGKVIPVEKTLSLWARMDGCDAQDVATPLRDATDDGTRVTRVDRGGCGSGARVVLFRVDGGGHTWPGGMTYLPDSLVGRTSRDFDACDAIWSFFAALP
jgi:polyhydroxybutyrate depolymerase